jgi:hypothetical protein
MHATHSDYYKILVHIHDAFDEPLELSMHEAYDSGDSSPKIPETWVRAA